ncbi:hypothetical protein C8J57DRAFT_1712081 [Mycena rebaudengoi]|nr:hypothetical protein C8J57DRAFT_1712081 [Mycena rebaudengoi]
MDIDRTPLINRLSDPATTHRTDNRSHDVPPPPPARATLPPPVRSHTEDRHPPVASSSRTETPPASATSHYQQRGGHHNFRGGRGQYSSRGRPQIHSAHSRSEPSPGSLPPPTRTPGSLPPPTQLPRPTEVSIKNVQWGADYIGAYDQFVALIKAAGYGPVPYARRLEAHNDILYAEFAALSEAKVFAAAWNRWCRNTDYRETNAMVLEPRSEH